jgi:hypothetical protein
LGVLFFEGEVVMTGNGCFGIKYDGFCRGLMGKQLMAFLVCVDQKVFEGSSIAYPSLVNNSFVGHALHLHQCPQLTNIVWLTTFIIHTDGHH